MTNSVSTVKAKPHKFCLSWRITGDKRLTQFFNVHTLHSQVSVTLNMLTYSNVSSKERLNELYPDPDELIPIYEENWCVYWLLKLKQLLFGQKVIIIIL